MGTNIDRHLTPLASAGKPISTLGWSSCRSSGTRGSCISTSISTRPSTMALAATRRMPSWPSSAVTSSTSWSYRRALITTALVNCMSTGRCMPARSGSTSAITLERLLASALAPACGWYPRVRTLVSTRCLVAAEMVRLPLST